MLPRYLGKENGTRSDVTCTFSQRRIFPIVAGGHMIHYTFSHSHTFTIMLYNYTVIYCRNYIRYYAQLNQTANIIKVTSVNSLEHVG